MARSKAEVVTLYAVDWRRFAPGDPAPEVVELPICKITEKQVRVPRSAAVGFRSVLDRCGPDHYPDNRITCVQAVFRHRGEANAFLLRELSEQAERCRAELRKLERHEAEVRARLGAVL